MRALACGDHAVFDVRASVCGTDSAAVIAEHRRIVVFGSGDVHVDEQVTLPDQFDDVARVGSVFEVAAGFEGLEWFGLGPLESYPDRRASAAVGRWRSTVSDQFVPYLVPQEHGLHMDTRWLALARSSPRAGVLVAASAPAALAMSAGHYTADDLWHARDLTELHPRAETIVHVDAAHRGLGTLSCGPDTLPRYRVAPGAHRWQWRLRAYDPRREQPGALARLMQTVTE